MQKITNKVQLTGMLNEIPQFRTTPNEGKMVRFSLGTTDTYRSNKGEKVTETQWHRVVAWDEIANVIEELLDKKLLTKGKEVAVSGKLVHNTYEDKNGQKRHFTEVQIDEFVVLSGNYTHPTKQ